MGKKKTDSSSETDGEEYQVEKIMDRRVKKGKVEYYIKWEGYPQDENTWEPIDNLDCPELIAQFEKARQSSSKDEDKKEKDSASSSKSKTKPKTNKRKGDDDDSEGENGTSKKSKKLVLDSDESEKEDEPVEKKSKTKPSSEKSKVKKKEKDTEDESQKSKNGDFKDLIPDKILGATDIDGPLKFLIKWKGTDKAELVPAKVANVQFPQTVIAFYENRLIWHSAKDKGDKDKGGD
ncbi:hypothetical protein DMENIID0001_123330 [Sergentomyia squamirostris]